MEQEIKYLKVLYFNGEVFLSIQKDTICVRIKTGGWSNFESKTGKFKVDITDTMSFHKDRVKLMMNGLD